MIKVITQERFGDSASVGINMYGTKDKIQILGWFGSNSDYIILGSYKTAKRAEEVMKQMDEHVEKCHAVELRAHAGIKPPDDFKYIFEMPEK